MATITHATMESDLRMASVLDARIRVLLADFATIRRVPNAVEYLGSVNGRGSDTVEIPYAGLDGYDAMAATGAEDTDVGSSDVTDASPAIAVARHAIRRDLGDLAALTGGAGNIDVARLAASMVGEYERAWMTLLGTVLDDFTAIVSNAGDLTVDDFLDAKYTLQINKVPGPYFALLAPRQITDLTESARAESGPMSYRQDLQAIFGASGVGYQFDLASVSVFSSDQLVSSGGLRRGALWGAGGVGWMDGQVLDVPGAVFVRPDSALTIEMQRDASKALTEIVGHAYLGMSVLEDGRGVQLRSSAS